MTTVLTDRNVAILKIIVDEYIATGDVLGSKLLLKKYNLWVSPATVRNDMAQLEKLELIFQPYNSAGRLPTSKGLRAFVNYLMDQTPNHLLKAKNVDLGYNDIKRFADFSYKVTYELAKTTWEIAFFVVPDRHISQYAGVTNFLKTNRERLWESIYSIIDMFEDKFSFMKFIESLPINNPGANIFIGEENILPFLADYTLIIKPVQIDGDLAYVWVLGSLQMNYSFNISAVNGVL